MTSEELDCDLLIIDLQQKVAELGQQLEHDRSLVADCITRAKKVIRSCEWLTEEGRGSYEWNDERYRDEFKKAAEGFLEALKPMEKVAQNWSGCPTSAKDIADARIDLKQKVAQLTAELEATKKLLADTAAAYECEARLNEKRLEELAELRKLITQLQRAIW